MFSSKNFVALAPKMRSGTHTEVTFEAGVGKSPSFVVGRGRVDLSYFPHWPALSFLSKSADLRRSGPDPQTRPPATPAAPTSLDRRGCAVGSRIGSRQCPGGSCFFGTVDKARSRLFRPPRFHVDLGTSLPALRSEAAGRSLGAAPGGRRASPFTPVPHGVSSPLCILPGTNVNGTVSPNGLLGLGAASAVARTGLRLCPTASRSCSPSRAPRWPAPPQPLLCCAGRYSALAPRCPGQALPCCAAWSWGVRTSLSHSRCRGQSSHAPPLPASCGASTDARCRASGGGDASYSLPSVSPGGLAFCQRCPRLLRRSRDFFA